MSDAEWDLDDGRGPWLTRKRLLAVVVLAAVVATVLVYMFVLGIPEGNVDRTPQASVEIRTDPGANGWGTGDETVVVRHDGGERIDHDQLYLRVSDDDTATVANDGIVWTGTNDRGYWSGGDTATYTSTLSKDAFVSLVWVDDLSNETAVLDEWALTTTEDTFTTTPAKTTTTERDTTTVDSTTATTRTARASQSRGSRAPRVRRGRGVRARRTPG